MVPHIDLLKCLCGRDRVCEAKRCRELCSHIGGLKSTIRVSEAMLFSQVGHDVTSIKFMGIGKMRLLPGWQAVEWH